jgi:hypothetical protein
MVFLMSILVMGGASADNGSDYGTISGTLLLDGEPLVGVQVFLGINPPFGNPGFEGHSTCTDLSGVFKFENVPFNTPLISVTGLDGRVPGCDNGKFVDPTSNPEHPLVGTILLRFGTMIEANTVIDPVEVPRFPDEEPGLTAHVRSALKFCYDKHMNDEAVKQVDTYLRQVDEKEVEGVLDSDAADWYRSFGDGLLFQFSFAGNCPAS